MKAFKRGVELYNEKSYASALASMPSDPDARATAVGDYVLLYRGRFNLMAKQNKEALSDFRLLESLYPDSPLIDEALMGQCQALLELNDPKSIQTILSRYKGKANAEALYYRARSLDQAGDKKQAIELYLQVYARYPTSKHSDLAEASLLTLSPGALSGARNYSVRLQRAEGLLNANDARAARVLLLALGRVSAPDARSSQKRNLLLADAEYRLGRTSSALNRLGHVTEADPALHARAIHLQGACNRRLDREQALLSLRDMALKLYPLSSETEELCLITANHFVVNHEPAKAREAFKLLYQAFPKGRYAESALWKISLYSYFNKEYSDAALGFWNYLLLKPDPLSASSSLYWIGRCCEKQGDSQKAQYFYGRAKAFANNSYYGQRSREAEAALQKSAMGESTPVSVLDMGQVAATCDKIQFSPVLLGEPSQAEARVIERARQLAAADLSDLALSELGSGIRRNPQSEDTLSYIMARIYADRGDYNDAIWCLRRAFPDHNGLPDDALPDEVWQLMYPVRHLEIISTQAARNRIDMALILGLIRQESGFEVKARSRANARGLMQILPSTGRKLARQAKMRRYSSNALYSAETNINLGTRYLASLIRQYGKAELALAAYNAGENRVDRWVIEFGDADMAEFVEQIPFSETRNYVKQVLGNRARYELRTSSSTAAVK